MATRLNQEALEHAQNPIKGRQYERNSDWSQAQPSAEEENEFIDDNGWEAFARWHLAYETEASEETKSRHKFPFGARGRLRACADRLATFLTCRSSERSNRFFVAH